MILRGAATVHDRVVIPIRPNGTRLATRILNIEYSPTGSFWVHFPLDHLSLHSHVLATNLVPPCNYDALL